MAAGFTKLFSSITDSTVWAESHATRIVWVTMLSMADQRGYVGAAVPGLAHRARVTLEECEHALARFLAPDPYSRSPENEGRRIELADGGWRLLNYAKYREARDEDVRRQQNRDAQRRHRERSANRSANVLTVSKVSQGQPGSAQAEAEADIQSRPYVGQTPPDAPPIFQAPKLNPYLTQARLLIEFLNAKTGRNYQPVEANLRFIVALLKSGVSADDIRSVIAKKSREWIGNPKMNEYLRPATLFNATKFAQYHGELIPEDKQRAMP